MVVDRPPTQLLPEIEMLVVEAPPFSVARPDRVAAPAVRELDPMLMVPKPEAIEPEERAPTVVREEVTTPEPRVLLERTLVPLTW